ncbi:asparagine synthetase A [Sphaerisporangium rubeum]|uniref:Asparaginyl-tRNA synthetase n=1 Tax=Sphaerisporangium rubeum TaxID=321317 RepID=A0A7X0IKQ1_9ACTN|nr:asparagine synthetase A [Sphaerisporangium rubeum]MBB6476723.1 asparaginyl-tRNA synthetase [Sphaerisporangium rubeum]
MTTHQTEAAIGCPPDIRDHLMSPVTRRVLGVRHEALRAAREFLDGAGFVELQPPLVGPVTDPGARGAKQVDIDYYGHRYKVMTSAILYKQASLLAFDKIYYIAPNLRLEPLETRFTGRHLTEFYQLDVEVAHASCTEIMDLSRDLVTHVIGSVVANRRADLAALGRDTGVFAPALTGLFDRVTHTEAVTAIRGMRLEHNEYAEIDWRGEELLSLEATRPFFVTGYPKGSRGFYDRESRTQPGLLRDFDLLAPEGYGELASGGEREFEYRRVVQRMRETGENPAKYGWYLDLVRQGIPPSAGFGLGVERLTRYLAGLEAVAQATAFPKLPGVPSP